jgi:hypothetical protein
MKMRFLSISIQKKYLMVLKVKANIVLAALQKFPKSKRQKILSTIRKEML